MSHKSGDVNAAVVASLWRNDIMTVCVCTADCMWTELHGLRSRALILHSFWAQQEATLYVSFDRTTLLFTWLVTQQIPNELIVSVASFKSSRQCDVHLVNYEAWLPRESFWIYYKPSQIVEEESQQIFVRFTQAANVNVSSWSCYYYNCSDTNCSFGCTFPNVSPIQLNIH